MTLVYDETTPFGEEEFRAIEERMRAEERIHCARVAARWEMPPGAKGRPTCQGDIADEEWRAAIKKALGDE